MELLKYKNKIILFIPVYLTANSVKVKHKAISKY